LPLLKFQPSYIQHNYCSFSLTHKNVYQFTRTEQKAPDYSEGGGSLTELWVRSTNLASRHHSGV